MTTELINYLESKGVEPKVHYPVPIHLQKAAKHLGYDVGSFPECENEAKEILTLPAHQYISEEQIDYVVNCMTEFYEAQ